MSGFNRKDALLAILDMTRNLHRYVHDAADKAIESEGLENWFRNITGRQLQMVVTVKDLCQDQPEGISLSELARKTGISNPSASSMVETLVRKGLLERKESPADRRSVRIGLSPSAKERFRLGDEMVMQTLSELTEKMSRTRLLNWRSIASFIEMKIKEAKE